MKKRIIAGFCFMFIGNLIAGEYNIDGFCRDEKSMPQASNDIIEAPGKGALPKTSVDEKLKPGELILRRGFGGDEYCIYKGTRSSSMLQQELFVFNIPRGMSLSQMLNFKYYMSKQIDNNPGGDIRGAFNIYFDNSNIYVDQFSTIYWKENEEVHSLTGISIKDLKAKNLLWGALGITYTPTDAEIYIDNEKKIPSGIGTLNLLNQLPGEYLVSIRKTGYQTKDYPVTVKPKSEELLTKISINLLSAYGTLVINSEPTGMQVKIKYVNKGQSPIAENFLTPVTQPDLEPGDYLVQIYSPDAMYLPAKDTTITVRKNDTTKLFKQLTPDFGSLSITSTQTGAAISIDGKSYGPAPLNIPRFKAGKYTVTATLAMYKTDTESITVNRGGKDAYTMKLKPDFGTVILKEISPGEYTVDGEPVPAGLRNLPAGQHQIVFNGKDLYKSMEWIKTIKADDRITLGDECIRLTGGITINPTPPDAEVFVDNQKKGVGLTPVPNFPTGNHIVSAKKIGYKLTSVPIFVKEGEDTIVYLTLPQIPDRDGDGVEDNDDPCPDEYGTVNGCISTETIDLLINSDPVEATIIENQKTLGITPVRLTLFEGKHYLMFYHTDYKDTTIELDVLKESSHKINIELTPTDEMLKQITAQKQARQDSVVHAMAHKKRASMRTRQITFGCLGLLLGGAGYYFNTRYDKTYKDYLAVKDPNATDSKWKAVDKNRQYRNWLYIGAGVFGGLCTVSFIF